MARIVDPATQERSVPRQGGTARIALQGPSDAPARALMELGRDIGRSGEEIFRAQKIEEERINVLRAEDAYNQLRQKQLDLTLSEDGYAHLKGAEAVTKPILPEYRQRFDDAEREIANGLSNDRQRALFKPRADISRLQYEEGMLRHLAEQGDVYAKQVYDATVTQAERDATVRWNSPHDVAGSIARVQSAVRERAERYGWSDEYRDEAMRGEISKIHASVITQAIASEQYKYAQRWYEANKENIDLRTAAVLQRAVQDGAQKDMTAGFNRDFLVQRDSRAGLEALGKQVLSSDLDETRKNIVYGRIVGRIETLDLRAERQRLQAERLVSGAIDGANANTFAGMPSSIEQLTPIVEAAKGTSLEPEAKRMVQIANATQGFSNMTPVAQANAITAAEAQVRSDPSKFDRRLLSAWKEIHTNQQALLEKDPNSFAERQGIAEPSVIDLANPVASADALTRRFSQTRALQVQYGSPNLPLKEMEAKAVSRALEGVGWRERSDYLRQLFVASKGDVGGYSGIMSQIAKDHPVTAIAGEYAAKGRSQASELMLAGEDILRPSKRADGKPDGSGLLPLPAESDMRSEFDDTVRDAYAGRPELRNTMYQAARAIYAKLASDAGVKDTKSIDGDLWEQATNLATGGVQRHNGRSIPMPYGMDLGEFRDQVRRRTEDMQAAGALPEGITASQLQTLPLEPVGDGRYVFRSGTGVLVHRQGEKDQQQPILLDFNRSPAYRPSGYGLEPQSEYDRWMSETGGKLKAGEDTNKAIERWRRGTATRPSAVDTSKKSGSGKPPKPAGETPGVVRG